MENRSFLNQSHSGKLQFILFVALFCFSVVDRVVTHRNAFCTSATMHDFTSVRCYFTYVEKKKGSTSPKEASRRYKSAFLPFYFKAVKAINIYICAMSFYIRLKKLNLKAIKIYPREGV